MYKVKKIVLVFVVSLLLGMVLVLPSCTHSSGTSGQSTKISFKQAFTYSELKSLNGKRVSINGYLATSSPVDGSFIFLMNLPYQSCPFCVANTSKLSNTMEVYPKKGEKFSYTNQAVKVVGTLVVAEDENKPFMDLYGYEFNFKIIDAEFTVLKDSDLTPELVLWQKVANSDIISEVYSMYDYLNFVCDWPEYFVQSYIDENGNEQKGFYLYASDALSALSNSNGQFYYGREEGYFDRLIQKIQKIDPDAFSDLVANIQKAKSLSDFAYNELINHQYSSEYRYVEQFDTYDTVYSLNKQDELLSSWENLFSEFSAWLGGWEL